MAQNGLLKPDISVCHNAPVLFHVGDVIRKLRAKRGWSLADLADRTDVDKGTISALERGESNYRRITLERLAAAFELRADDLFSYLPEPSEFARPGARKDSYPPDHWLVRDDEVGEEVDVSGYVRRDIPTVGDAEATRNGIISWNGEGLVNGDIEHWISRPKWIRDQKAYALKVRGDSMVPRYFPGETIIVAPNSTLRSGNFACVQLKSGERLIKRVYRQETGWNLVSVNEAYPPRFVTDDEIAAIHKIVHNSHEAA